MNQEQTIQYLKNVFGGQIRLIDLIGRKFEGVFLDSVVAGQILSAKKSPEGYMTLFFDYEDEFGKGHISIKERSERIDVSLSTGPWGRSFCGETCEAASFAIS